MEKSYHTTLLIPLTKKRTYLIRKERCAFLYDDFKSLFLNRSSVTVVSPLKVRGAINETCTKAGENNIITLL